MALKSAWRPSSHQRDVVFRTFRCRASMVEGFNPASVSNALHAVVLPDGVRINSPSKSLKNRGALIICEAGQ
jgi:hypothetical protein